MANITHTIYVEIPCKMSITKLWTIVQNRPHVNIKQTHDTSTNDNQGFLIAMAMMDFL